MKGTILEWKNAKGENRIGLLTQGKQHTRLQAQGRAAVYLLDENYNLQKNEKGGLILAVVTMDRDRVKVIGFQD